MNAADSCWGDVDAAQYTPVGGQPILWTPDLSLALLGRDFALCDDEQPALFGSFHADDTPDYPLYFLAPDSWDGDESFTAVLRLSVIVAMKGTDDAGHNASWACYAGLDGHSGPKKYFSGTVAGTIMLSKEWRAGSLPTGLTTVQLAIDAGAGGSPADTTTATLVSAVLQFAKA